MLTGPEDGKIDPGSEEISARIPSAAELTTAELALAAIPPSPTPRLYARVDLIPGADGAPVLLALELTEPSLFFLTAPSSAARLADAVQNRL